MMKKIGLLCFLLAASLFTFGQQADSVYHMADVMPEYPGGEKGMLKFLTSNLAYPKMAKEQGITGIVYASFIVNKDGSISDAKIVKDIGGGCGEEVLNAIHKMPPWIPGSLSGKKVRVEYTLPVAFEMDDDDTPNKRLSKKEKKALRKMERQLKRETK